jgi:hypothetical protein
MIKRPECDLCSLFVLACGLTASTLLKISYQSEQIIIMDFIYTRREICGERFRKVYPESFPLRKISVVPRAKIFCTVSFQPPFHTIRH